MLSSLSMSRHSQRVLQDLSDHTPATDGRPPASSESSSLKLLASVGFGLILWAAVLGLDGNTFVVGVVVAAGAYLFRDSLGISRRHSQERLDSTISYLLPLAVEELVMAVRAGHDVYAAIRLVVPGEGVVDNPVYEVFGRIIQEVSDGFSLESALRTHARSCCNTALRHTLMHLAVAHRDGGGLLFALSELADATQTFYEDKIEEEIAGLPVKATLPLVFIFAGVLLLFMTPPILEVVQTTLRPVM